MRQPASLRFRSLVLRFLVAPSAVSLVWVPYVLCIGGFLLTMMLYYPGKPAMLMLHEARSGVYTNAHPAIMAATLHLMFYICQSEPMGLRLLYVLQSLMCWLGLFLVLLSGKRFWSNQYPKSHLLVIACLVPLLALWLDVLISSPNLWKDFLHFSNLLLATGLLLNMPRKISLRCVVGSVILFLLFYGTALRHNSVVGLFPMLCWLVWHFIPQRKVLIAFFAGILLCCYLATNYMVTYQLLRAHPLYPLQERFYADIFMLNYFGKHYKNPPNVFGNDFDDITKEFFKKEYLYQYMYVPHAFRNIGEKKSRSFCLVMEGVHVDDDTGEPRAASHPPAEGVPRFTVTELRSFASDYAELRRAWIERILMDLPTYVSVRAYFTLRFLFISSPTVLLIVSGGIVNGVYMLTSMALIVAYCFFSRNQFSHRVPVLALAWTALLNGLPLFVFLPADGPGNIRVLYWFFAASFIAITCFCFQSVLFHNFVQRVHCYLEQKANE